MGRFGLWGAVALWGAGAALPAQAGLCEEGLATASAPLLRPVIDGVLAGDYRAMTQALDPSGFLDQGARQEMIATLEGRQPLGYDDCAVLVARPLSPEFEIYLVMFGADRARLYAFLAVSRINGDWSFVYQKFSTDFAEVYALLR